VNTVDGVRLDEDNAEFNLAVDCLNNTRKNIYLTGKAGTGKTTFLKYICGTTKRNFAVVAPTGVAALNARGQTIHSLFHIRPSVYPPNDKRLRLKAPSEDPDKNTFYNNFPVSKETNSLLQKLDVLIIDEVSMVRCDLLDVVDLILQVRRNRIGIPFGGVQVVFIGDPFQLAPITKGNERDILDEHYNTPFFFSSRAYTDSTPLYIELKKIYRQSELDFIHLLNGIRINEVSESRLNDLNKRHVAEAEYKPVENEITLTTHNETAQAINERRNTALASQEYQYQGEVSGKFDSKDLPTEMTLKLKLGAQVMFVKNDPAKKFHNGKIGTISKLSESEIFVDLGEGHIIPVERTKWKNITFEWSDESQSIVERDLGEFIQYPIKLAWAITSHKSQGLTFEHVYADLNGSFASGQVYVALSRCTSLNGLRLRSKIGRTAIITDPDVLEFSKMHTPETLIVDAIQHGKADRYYAEARGCLHAAQFTESYDKFILAIKHRNDIATDSFKSSVLNFLSDNKRCMDENDDLRRQRDNQAQRIAVLDRRNAELEEMVQKQQDEIEFHKNRKWYNILFKR